MHGYQKSCGELAELTVDDMADRRWWRPGTSETGTSSQRGTMELGGEDNDGLSQQACTALAEEYLFITPLGQHIKTHIKETYTIKAYTIKRKPTNMRLTKP